MQRTLLIALVAAASFAAEPVDRQELTSALTFEAEHSGASPKGWGGDPPETIGVDGEIVHGGKWSVRLHRDRKSNNGFSTITRRMPITFSGKTVEFRGFLRTKDVSEFAGLWMRQDGATPALAFDNMQRRQLKGDTEWAEYSLSLPVHPDAEFLYYGVLGAGTGAVWADDLQLLVDGKPIWEAPPLQKQPTVLDTDKDFDSGSRISLESLSPVQGENIALLGKVWGFLKYHHPRVTSGQMHWDYELFRVMPKVLAAGNAAEAQKGITDWITSVGKFDDCTRCASLDDGKIHLHPNVDWIRDEARLGKDLSAALQSAWRNRPANRKQFYVSLNPGIGNANLERELPYAGIAFPDAGFQILGLFRFWNIVAYWFPYRDVIGEDWDGVLREFVPRMALAKNKEAYQLESMALIARVHDTHANLWSGLAVRPPTGTCALPAKIRFIEDVPAVTAYSGPDKALMPGDMVEAIDGVAAPELVKRWTPYYAASNRPTAQRDIGRFMTRGDCAAAKLRIRRAGELREAVVTRVTAGPPRSDWHDLPGPEFRRLSDDVAYLKLSAVKAEQAAEYVKRAAGTKGLVIDIRNYPSAFMVFTLGSLFVDRPTNFVRFTHGDLANPGAFHFTEPLTLNPQKPHYDGKIVILIDEVTQSSAEYTTMAFRSSPKAVVIGSTTAAADGNVSPFPLPGNLRTMISGIGVFYPDKRPTQRVGIIPDVEVRPTLAGIREGRDEVLERGLSEILGPGVSDAELRKLSQPTP